MTRADLIAALEKAEGPSRELDAAIFLASVYSHEAQAKWQSPPAMPIEVWARLQAPAYTKSLDAALQLNPGWFWRAGSGAAAAGWAHLNRYQMSHCDARDETHAEAKTPAIALCIAALKARE